jgi:hypothetical protein
MGWRPFDRFRPQSAAEEACIPALAAMETERAKATRSRPRAVTKAKDPRIYSLNGLGALSA